MKWFLFIVAFVLICFPSFILTHYDETTSYFSLIFAVICFMVGYIPSEKEQKSGIGIQIPGSNGEDPYGYLVLGIPIFTYILFKNLEIVVTPRRDYGSLGLLIGLTIVIIMTISPILIRKYKLDINKDWQATMTMCTIMLLFSTINNSQALSIIAFIFASVALALPIASSRASSRWILFSIFTISLIFAIRTHPTLNYNFWGIFTLVLGIVLNYFLTDLFKLFQRWLDGEDDCGCGPWIIDNNLRKVDETPENIPQK